MIPILLLFLAVSLFEYRELMKQKRNREIVASTALLIVGITLGILQQLEVDIPSPMVGIQFLFQPLSQFVKEMLS